ncbi:MAG: PAS domain S-box protein, partial [Gemmatimonadetes bacterium]|nr:PAS domain S-box protein [Gemmatimonadota bacterium]
LQGPGAQLLAKAGAGVLLWPLAAWYLQGVAPGLTGRLGIEGRRPFDLVFGSYRRQEAALRSSTEERVKAQRALEATERRFRATFEQVGVGLVHADAQGRIQLANHAVCALVRRPGAELRGLPWEELVHPEDRGACREAFRSLLAGEIAGAEADRRYVRSDGTDFWAHDTLSLVHEAEGEPPYLVLAVESIEDRRGTEERMRHLERMEAVGQLTGGVAHDFNNLLTVIIGGLDLALSDPSEEEEKRIALEDAQEAARRGAELTRRLLAFSRKQALRPTSLDPRKLVDDLAPLLKRTLGETVEVETSVAPDAGWCTADRAQMENAIINLALNARDAMPDGGRLTLRCDRVTVTESDLTDAEGRPGAYVRISVTDTGLGIAPEHLPRIFEPFFTTKEIGKGSGLGLSMVYGFVQQSGGFVTVDSEVAKGTSVRLHVPAE